MPILFLFKVAPVAACIAAEREPKGNKNEETTIFDCGSIDSADWLQQRGRYEHSSG
jgi:hypothetical protein